MLSIRRLHLMEQGAYAGIVRHFVEKKVEGKSGMCYSYEDRMETMGKGWIQLVTLHAEGKERVH